MDDFMIAHIDRSNPIDLDEGLDPDDYDGMREVERKYIAIGLAVSDDLMQIRAYHDDEYGWQPVTGESDSTIYYPLKLELKEKTVKFKGIEITRSELRELQELMSDWIT